MDGFSFTLQIFADTQCVPDFVLGLEAAGNRKDKNPCPPGV